MSDGHSEAMKASKRAQTLLMSATAPTCPIPTACRPVWTGMRVWAQWCVTGSSCKFTDGWCNECGKPERPSWPETWMTVAFTMAERSYDPRLKVGAIVVSADNTQMLSVGYNGNYRGGPHVHESSEPGKSGFIHAEVNSLVKCDFNFPKKKHMYVTHSPCRDCAKLIINAEIARVVYKVPYRDTSGVELLRSAGVEVLSYEEAILTPR